MQVIGWTGATDAPAGPWALTGPGPLQMVLADIPEPVEQSERLRAMLICFEHGLDFIPLPPVAQLGRSEAAQLIHDRGAEIAHIWKAIAGHGQMTLLLSAARPSPATPTGTGRAWLQARRQHHEDKNGAFKIMEMVVSPFPYRRQISTGPAGIRCDLLVPRVAVRQLKDRLAALSDCPALRDQNLSLTICGPWPAFHFTALPELAYV